MRYFANRVEAAGVNILNKSRRVRDQAQLLPRHRISKTGFYFFSVGCGGHLESINRVDAGSGFGGLWWTY